MHGDTRVHCSVEFGLFFCLLLLCSYGVVVVQATVFIEGTKVGDVPIFCFVFVLFCFRFVGVRFYQPLCRQPPPPPRGITTPRLHKLTKSFGVAMVWCMHTTWFLVPFLLT